MAPRTTVRSGLYQIDRLLHGVAAIHGDVIDRSLDASRRHIVAEVGGQIGVAIERRHPATRLMMGPDCGTAIRRFTFESSHVVRGERLSTRCDGPEGIGARSVFIQPDTEEEVVFLRISSFATAVTPSLLPENV